MDLDEIRDTLLSSVDAQHEADLAATATNQKLGEQQIMYNNDARGTLYSGQPTWERARLAAQGVSDVASINDNYLNKKIDIWGNITDVLDKINSYNKAADAMRQAAANYKKQASNATQQAYADIYANLFGGSTE